MCATNLLRVFAPACVSRSCPSNASRWKSSRWTHRRLRVCAFKNVHVSCCHSPLCFFPVHLQYNRALYLTWPDRLFGTFKGTHPRIKELSKEQETEYNNRVRVLACLFAGLVFLMFPVLPSQNMHAVCLHQMWITINHSGIPWVCFVTRARLTACMPFWRGKTKVCLND